MLSSHFVDFEHIGQSDKRWDEVAKSTSGNSSICDLKRWYDAVATVECQTILPEVLEKRLNEIKNLLVFSWFNYSFASTAFFLSVLLVEAYLKTAGVLPCGQTLGAFLRLHATDISDKQLVERLKCLVNIRNRLTHHEVLLYAPTFMLIAVKSTLDIISELANYDWDF
jgi:hypothetical protein